VHGADVGNIIGSESSSAGGAAVWLGQQHERVAVHGERRGDPRASLPAGRGMPGAAGPYAYTRMAFGELPAFLIIWGYWIGVGRQCGDRDR
jgi:hypothetical protein